MIPHVLACVWVNQRAQRTPPNNQPAHESPKLLRIEYIDFKHADRVRANRSLKERVNPQLGELATDALMQLFGIPRLRGGGLLEVDVDVEAAAGAVDYRGLE